MIGSTETSRKNYNCSLRNSPEKRFSDEKLNKPNWLADEEWVNRGKNTESESPRLT